ncbi:hypothetical protein M433DRAFT_117029 [Acidomyces richmondensis BFW]|nr:hypothetical protein M433DRAFT_117229 [Acidomyces richmondensis BFW]KYG40399.1 hypothetical protein M433DRAFT_117029 [Acidomyces richmondensis BFW]
MIAAKRSTQRKQKIVWPKTCASKIYYQSWKDSGVWRRNVVEQVRSAMGLSRVRDGNEDL